MRPHVHALEKDDIYPAEMVEQMKALGLFGATIGTAYGGLGLSATTYARIVQRVSEVWMSLAGIFNSHLIMAACVERVGTEEQKRAWLPRFATGELRGGLALTEPDCGTDLQAIRTRAVRAGNDAYLVNGTKTWISNGIHGQVFALLVKTDPEAEPRHKGMSMLLAEKGPGFRVSRKLEKIGYKGIDFGRADLRGLPRAGGRPYWRRRGPRPADGAGRTASSAASTWRRAAAASPRRRSTNRCATRSCARPSASRSPSTRRSSSSWRRWRSAPRRPSRSPTMRPPPTTKGAAATWRPAWPSIAASEAAVENALEAMRIHGAYGYSKEFNIERYYRDAPLLVIGEGTNELQKIIIARQLVERNRI